MKGTLEQLPVDAVADFLRDYPSTRSPGLEWTHFASLTFVFDVNEERARQALRWWLRASARHAARHIPYAFAAGVGTNRHMHLHVLLAVPVDAEPIPTSWLDHYWRQSDAVAHFARVVRYDPDLGAVRYIAGHQGFWDLNVACPRAPRCRRNRGCVEAPGPWA